MNIPAMRYAARQETTTGASPPSTTGSPQFFFGLIDQMSTCGPASIAWAYVGPSSPFELIITNNDVPQTASIPPLPSSTSSISRNPPTLSNNVARAVPTGANLDGLVIETLTTNLPPYDSSFTWNKVNVPQGWYKLTASLPSASYSSDSSAFFVRNSSDVSCLIAATPPSTLTPTHTGPSSSVTSSLSASPSETVAPVSSGGVSKGAIAGSVIGGLAVILACIAAFLFIRFSKSSSSVSSRRSGPRSGNWGGLASVDSTHSQGGNKSQHRSYRPKSYLSGGAAAASGLNSSDRSTRAQKHHSQSDSINPILSSQTQLATPSPGTSNGARVSHSVATSEEDVSSSAHSPFDEKYMESGGMFDMVPPLPMNRDTSVGHNSVATANTHMTRRSSTSSQTQPRIRRVSVDRDRSYQSSGELIPMTRSPSSPSSPSHASSPRSQSSAPTSPSILPPGGLSSPTSQSNNNRRTPRKPVPSYDPNDISLSPFLPSAEPPSASTAAYNPSSSNIDVFAGGEEDKVSVHSTRGVKPPGFPDLNHKSSFGPGDGRPMHYLIPDLPPPQKD